MGRRSHRRRPPCLTPLFWAHVLPYGEVKLNMTNGLALSATQPPDPDDEDR